MNSENLVDNVEKANLYMMCDVVTERWFPVTEYANDRSAIRAMGMLRLPPALKQGDLMLFKVGEREGFELRSLAPVEVWSCPETAPPQVNDLGLIPDRKVSHA